MLLSLKECVLAGTKVFMFRIDLLANPSCLFQLSLMSARILTSFFGHEPVLVPLASSWHVSLMKETR